MPSRNDDKTPEAVAAAPADATGEDHLDRVAKEYGQFRARVAIDLQGARAFNPGDPVPASHISSGLVDIGLVETTTEKG